MDLGAVLRVALRALARNKMRTVLTMLGIIIGVGAVICTVAIGEGASNQVQESLRNLGDNIVFVAAGSVNQHGVHMGSAATKTLVLGDAKAIAQQIPLIAKASPGVGAAAQVVYGNQNWYTRIRGVAPEYLDIRRWPVERGSAFTQREVDTAADVCLIGQTVVENLFGNEDPVGQTIRVQNLPFRVIGLLSSKGQSPFGNDEDDTLIMPFTTVQKKIVGIDWLNFVMCSATSREAIYPAEQQLAGLLRERHHLRPDQDDDFIIRSPTDLAEAQAQSGRIMTLLLASIASVSLLVGGIGIMNIMLVSVTERTREIGIRMAVGARGRDILRQFLVEAVLLSCIGGAIGFGLGLGASVGITKLINAISHGSPWPVVISIPAAIAAFIFSGAVGIFFGFYPARKASKLDPIEALRYE